MKTSDRRIYTSEEVIFHFSVISPSKTLETISTINPKALKGEFKVKMEMPK